MREIKFKAWLPEERRWLKDGFGVAAHGEGITEFGYDLEFDDVYIKRDYNDGEFVLMQYTGLKDKNGVEIHEGDIVVCDNRRCKVVWEQSDCSFRYEPEFSNRADGEGINRYVMPYNDDEEVIGNIYESPKLLEQTNA